MLNWEEVDVTTGKLFLKASPVNLTLDFMDLCKDRFWGGHNFHLDIRFSIHERIIKDKGWNYQLLAPNGIHIYCKDVEEAKEIAELMYRRIVGNFLEQINVKPEPEKLPEGEIAKKLNKSLDASRMTTEQLNRVLWKRHCKVQKFKTQKLSAFLENRGIVGRVWYSRLRGLNGWMFSQHGGQPILLGSNYEQALDMANSGSLDFYKAG